MAIFRAATKHISRGKGHNVVAAAAYRAGEKLTDTNKLNPNATTHDYTKKHGVLAKNIVLPITLSGQGFSIDRQELWSSVEEHETTTRSVKGSRLKQTARLAREWLLALPSELSDEENEQLTAEFTQKLADDLGVIGDYCIHKPTIKDYKPKADYIEWYDPDTQKTELVRVDDVKALEPDDRNIHAHIMFTTRKAKLTEDGELLLGDKADSERSEKWRKDKGMVNGGDYIKEVRGMWADMVNERLAQHDIAPISSKSYKDLGLDIVPTHKEGKDATVLALYGIKTPIRDINNDIKDRNRAALESAADSRVADYVETADATARAAETADQWLSRAVSNPFDSEQEATNFDEQSIVFNRLAERAAAVLAKPSKSLIDKAVQKYRSINSYEPTIQRSDWSGGGSEPNPQPNPILEFSQRQRDILDNISEHLTGFNGEYVSQSQLRDSLVDHDNERILILLTDPEREEMLYKQDEMARTEQSILSRPSLDITQQLQLEAGQEERKPTPRTPSYTYTPH